MDKTNACLNGIPPLLSRLYCDVKPCLDLSEEQLYLPQPELQLAISKLDSNGWNTEGKIYRVSVARAKWLLSAIREEILEMALGVNILITEERIA
jgi:hypothetical protein